VSTGSGLGLTIAKMLTDLMGGELSASSTVGQGSVFRVRLFLPELHLPEGVPAGRHTHTHRTPRTAYAGARRRVVVVDNEEADRSLLVSLLQPLGFEVRVAASGHDCLDLLAAGWRPDVVLLDLAMPGIDGWETLRRIRALGAQQHSAPTLQVAIVSANAFDRGLDNDLGIAPEDFFVKPLRHTELLDWLERKLALQWLDAPLPVAVPLQRAAPVSSSSSPGAPSNLPSLPPPRGELMALAELVRLGYFRGILNQLDAMAVAYPHSTVFTTAMTALARRYQFETMLDQLQTLLDDSEVF
jgi:CheY-like chemotaxis protein